MSWKSYVREYQGRQIVPVLQPMMYYAPFALNTSASRALNIRVGVRLLSWFVSTATLTLLLASSSPCAPTDINPTKAGPTYS